MVEERVFSAEVYENDKHEDWLILLHGFGGNARTWNKQIDTFSWHYNLLVLEMHKDTTLEILNLDTICELIHNTMLYHNVEKAHFIGFSFSSLISLRFAVLYPNNVSSLIMGGGVVRLSLKTRFLISVGIRLKHKVNYMFLYRFFAYVIMPKKNHRRSRTFFVNEARKLGHKEFCKWLNIIPQTANSLEWLNSLNKDISILFISGSQDYLFLNDTLKHSKNISNSYVEIIKGCGHVCSIEQSEKFNDIVINHLSRI